MVEAGRRRRRTKQEDWECFGFRVRIAWKKFPRPAQEESPLQRENCSRRRRSPCWLPMRWEIWAWSIILPGLGCLRGIKENPDVGMLVAHCAFTLSRLGLVEEVFWHPSSLDCLFIFENKRNTDPLLSPDFFSRPLWPTPGLNGGKKECRSRLKWGYSRSGRT
jgi:hypothetical protein